MSDMVHNTVKGDRESKGGPDSSLTPTKAAHLLHCFNAHLHWEPKEESARRHGWRYTRLLENQAEAPGKRRGETQLSPWAQLSQSPSQPHT